MYDEYGRNRVPWAILPCIALIVAAGPACGEPDRGPPEEGADAGGRWTRIELLGRYSWEGEVVEDEDLSGLAFISDKHGLVGADEARDVQVIELSPKTQTLRVVETVSLLRSGDEIDIEAIAAEGDCYYITGSHGISKTQGEPQGNRYRIFRLRVDPVTGTPAGVSVSGLRVPAAVEGASLASLVRTDPVLGGYFGQPLQQKGVNIEGLAVRNGRLFVGFRAPNLDGDAFVMELGADDVFGSRPRPGYTLHRLRLGAGLGIREIVATKSGFLLIAGNAGSEPSDTYPEAQDYEADRGFFLFAWAGTGPDVHRVGPLPAVAGKAEALAILEEAADHLTVLILFDGPRHGRPSLYRIR